MSVKYWRAMCNNAAKTLDKSCQNLSIFGNNLWSMCSACQCEKPPPERIHNRWQSCTFDGGENLKIHNSSRIYESKLRPSAIVLIFGRIRWDVCRSGFWKVIKYLALGERTCDCSRATWQVYVARVLAAKRFQQHPLMTIWWIGDANESSQSHLVLD